MAFNIPHPSTITGRFTTDERVHTTQFDYLLYRGRFGQPEEWKHYDVKSGSSGITQRISTWRKQNLAYKNMFVNGVEITLENADSTLLIMGII